MTRFQTRNRPMPDARARGRLGTSPRRDRDPTGSAPRRRLTLGEDRACGTALPPHHPTVHNSWTRRSEPHGRTVDTPYGLPEEADPRCGARQTLRSPHSIPRTGALTTAVRPFRAPRALGCGVCEPTPRPPTDGRRKPQCPGFRSSPVPRPRSPASLTREPPRPATHADAPPKRRRSQ
jgi:hypothetical protein